MLSYVLLCVCKLAWYAGCVVDFEKRKEISSIDHEYLHIFFLKFEAWFEFCR